MPTPPISEKLALEWIMLIDGRPALAFAKPTWQAYEATAATRSQTAQQLITVSVAAAIGPNLVDNALLTKNPSVFPEPLANQAGQGASPAAVRNSPPAHRR